MRITVLVLVLYATPVLAQEDIIVTFTLTGAAADAARAQQAADEAVTVAANVEIQSQRDSIAAQNAEDGGSRQLPDLRVIVSLSDYVLIEARAPFDSMAMQLVQAEADAVAQGYLDNPERRENIDDAVRGTR